MERSEQLQAGPSASSRCPIRPDTAFCFDPNALRGVRKIAQRCTATPDSSRRLLSSGCCGASSPEPQRRIGEMVDSETSCQTTHKHISMAVFVENCEEDGGPKTNWRRLRHRRLALAREHAQEETRYNKLTWTDTTKRARNGSTCSTGDDGPYTKTSDIAYLVPCDMDMPTDRCRRYHQWMI